MIIETDAATEAATGVSCLGVCLMESLSRSSNISDVNTDVLIQQYADRILVFVSQLDKVGSLVMPLHVDISILITGFKIQASLPATIPLENSNERDTQSTFPSPSPAIEITPLLSSAPSEQIQTLHNLYVSQIASLIWTAEAEQGVEGRRPVILAIALKRSLDSDEAPDQETFTRVMGMIQSILRSESSTV